jgi:iron complex transport system permease protein
VSSVSYPRLLLALSGLTVISFVASLAVGPTGLNFAELKGFLRDGNADTLALIFWELRLPRALLGAVIGASLALAGACLQGYMRNPLAEPGVIGISSASALGAVVAIYTGLALQFPLALPLLAIAGSLIAVIILQPLTTNGSTLTLILAGVAISSLCGALTSLALSVSPNPFASLEIVFWLLGSITDRSMTHFWLISPFIAVGWLMLAMTARPLDALSLGTETAVSLGVNMSQLRLLVTLGAACCVGAATAVSGVIGFVGLIVPHLLRPIVGFHPSRLLPASALGGASLLLSADVLVRLVETHSELHLGVVTALIGVPFFFYLVVRSRAAYDA